MRAGLRLKRLTRQPNKGQVPGHGQTACPGTRHADARHVLGGLHLAQFLTALLKKCQRFCGRLGVQEKLAGPLRLRDVGQAGENLEVQTGRRLGCQQQEDQLRRLIVRRLEVQARPTAANGQQRLTHARRTGMGDRDPAADPAAMLPLASLHVGQAPRGSFNRPAASIAASISRIAAAGSCASKSIRAQDSTIRSRVFMIRPPG